MSKHIFKQEAKGVFYSVEIGWDRPTQNYYCAIFPWKVDETEPEGGYFSDENPTWCSIYTHTFKKLDIETIEAKCEALGLIIPDGLLDNVQDDQKRDAVNELKFYDEDEPAPSNPVHPVAEPSP